MRHCAYRRICSAIGVCVGLLLPLAITQAGSVDPADITPLAELVGGLLAVPVARLFAALCVILAVLSLARGLGSVCLWLMMLAGIVLVAPAIVKAVVWRVAATVHG